MVDLAVEDDRATLTEALRRIEQGDPGDAAPERAAWTCACGPAAGRRAGCVDRLDDRAAELAETRLLVQWVDLSARRRAEQTRAELMPSSPRARRPRESPSG